MTMISTTLSLQEFFYELVRDAVANQRVEVSQETEYYLVQLLYRFTKTGEGYSRNEEGYNDEALVSLFSRATEADREARIQILKRLGDLALYIAGYFPESLSSKLIDVDYYVQMGGTAYSSVGAMITKPPVQSLFLELSNKFPHWVDILGEVSTQAQTYHNEQDLLRIYELWQRTGSLRALNLLQKEGILPHSGTDTQH